MVDHEKAERIYVGGLDPSRGLTVELVASRLCSVEDVEILSINDDSTKDKRDMVDEDGDLVDTRNFFFLEARATADPKSSTTSALDILAKQYHSVKWKGCQLRVEAANPHFLKRLEEERDLRSEIQERIKAHKEKELEEPTEEKVVKNRRRLRIRKRFGEEAYTVDTRPHPLELSPQDDEYGWDDFASLNLRMHTKRQTQQKKLVQRRKDERRLWASGKGSGTKDPATSESEGLRSLIFLNRGIHIRFSEEVGSKNEIVKEVVELENVATVATGGNVSDTSSSVPSSDSEESSEHQIEDGGGNKSYVWSDDDDDSEEDTQSDTSSEDNADTDAEKHKNGGGYAWSDGEDEGAKDETNDDPSTRIEDIEKEMMHKSVKKRVDGSEYTRAVTIDEFSGGMDFDSAPSNFEDALGDSEDDYIAGSDNDDASECRLEDDIRSNMGILATLFPDAQFEKQPLAASVTGDKDNAGESTGAGEYGNSPNTSSLLGAGMIMQRYDPTKESDKKFEVPQADKVTDIDKAKPPVGDGMSEDKSKKNKASVEETPLSSESPEGEEAIAKQGIKSEVESEQEDKPATKDDDKKLKAATDAGEKPAPAKDVYEQDKLDDIFKQAREGKPESFSLANMFQSEENISKTADMESEVYEQDKLEDVFKQAKGDNASNAGAGGFSFGFQSQLPDENAANDEGSSAPFSFGFNLNNSPKNENDINSSQKISEQNNNDPELKPDDDVRLSSTMQENEEQPKNEPSRRKRRMGMIFPESDLDAYEEMFFSLNEGPRILKNLDTMKQDEESQELWQKERLVLTADWKRKQKSASSRKVKKVRRF